MHKTEGKKEYKENPMSSHRPRTMINLGKPLGRPEEWFTSPTFAKEKQGRLILSDRVLNLQQLAPFNILKSSSNQSFLAKIPNFLNAEECAAIIDACRNLHHSPGRDGKATSHRTSMHSVEPDWSSNPVLSAIYARVKEICTVAGMTIEGGWPIRYATREKIGLHHDAGSLKYRNRYCTFLIYLNTVPVEHGGGTRFPNLHGDENYDIEVDGMLPVEERKQIGLVVQPVLGTAVWFRNIRHDCNWPDWSLRHEGLPVVSDKDRSKKPFYKWVIQFRGMKNT